MKVKQGLDAFIEREAGDLDGERVLIIDAHNLIYRTVHVANFSAPEDEDFEYWKYLMINSLFASIKRFEPTKVVYALDGYRSWRKNEYTEYKAHRKLDRNKSPRFSLSAQTG